MYKRENSMKNIIQSVLPQQLPSAKVQLPAVLGLDLWKVRRAEKLYSRAPFCPWASKASVR